MSLRRRLAIQLTAMLLGAIGISAAALWGINGLQQDYGVALAGYSELRQMYGSVGARLAIAAEMLRADPPNRDRAGDELRNATDQFDLFTSSDAQGPNHAIHDAAAERDIREALLAAALQLRRRIPSDADAASESARRDAASVDAALVRTGTFASRISAAIEQRQASAISKRHETILAVAITGAIAVLGAGIIGLLQYRGVVTPLARLGIGVRRISTGEFRSRLQESGPRELQELSRDFNRMAADLDEFYHRLEQKVAEKSRELTRSERLASVGYLAAGVAHEINNPIAIIAGHAELLLSQTSRGSSIEDDETRRSLAVICDEAFRCKDIVGKLLSLSRPREADPGEVDLAAAAQEVIAALGGIREYQDRRLVLSRGQEADLDVCAVGAEIKQVILNLLMNGLQAVGPGGEVRAEVARHGDWIQLRIRDDGRGMSAQTLERVFEPFYTERNGAREPGTGLGLSITHAIVQSHGGRISATSAGIGRGSEFVVEMPAARRVHS